MNEHDLSQPISLAPMVDKTDRDWRWIMRRITRKSLFYTEMITAPAVIRGNREQILAFDPSEKPVVLQLGWDEKKLLSESCRIAEDYGYDGINLNCGCPSEKVQRHQFGACLMADPDKVARLVEAMMRATSLPISVKNRIGIRSKKQTISLERYEDLARFTRIVSGAGCQKFTVHARIAILEGLNPRQNREVPPLRIADVFRLKEEFPQLFIEINGGYSDSTSIDAALVRTDAVMLGRVALDNPWFLINVDRRWFGSTQPSPSRREVLETAIPYMVRRAEMGASRGLLIQATMHLFAGQKGARSWRRSMTELHTRGPEGFASGLEEAVSKMPSAMLDEKTD